MDNLQKVSAELALYRHPFFEFSAVQGKDGVEVRIRSRFENVHTPEFRLIVTDREVESSQFRWSFQGLLYGSLNDYMVELFTRLPGD